MHVKSYTVYYTHLHSDLFNVTGIHMAEGRQSYSQSDNVLPFENNLRFGKGFDDEFASNKILW